MSSSLLLLRLLERLQSCTIPILRRIQRKLAFDDWYDQPQFDNKHGLGRVSLIGCILGICLGIHVCIWIQISFHWIIHSSNDIFTTINDNDKLSSYNNNNNNNTIITSSSSSSTGGGGSSSSITLLFLWQWCTYMICLCIFHLLEFYITAVYNPTTCTSESYLINHSIAYTFAAISSWFEFWIRYIIIIIILYYFVLYNNNSSYYVSYSYYYYYQICMISVGIVLLLGGQYIRTKAMIIAGESFNHHIQISRKQNHILITHSIYKYIRHPSYCGFYFWCIGTQCMLGNIIHVIAFTIASYIFFQRRIEYEEESLCTLFPNEYPIYAHSTYSGIPFLYTKIRVPTKQMMMKKKDEKEKGSKGSSSS